MAWFQLPKWSRSLLKWRPWGERAPVVPVVRLAGVIGEAGPLAGGLSLSSVAEPLDNAFSTKRAKAVALIVNSPGGSPVQSSLIFRHIRALAEEKDLEVYVFAEDVAASGGYMIACAGDHIYVNESSVVGSVGVISAGFGFERLIEKIGIERRVHTAGKAKSVLDPFLPEKPEDVERLKALQQEVHETFKALVLKSREGKLTAPADEIFTGAFWAGQGAIRLGLADGVGDVRSVMRERFGDKVVLQRIGVRKPWWHIGRRINGRAENRHGLETGLPVSLPFSAVALVEALSGVLERRALWGRFGL